MSSRRAFIIGISGTTNSGKSTLASMLQSSMPDLNIEVIGQDQYFREPNDPLVPVTENGVGNWDCLGALHMDKMASDVINWIKTKEKDSKIQVLILEGFLMFTYRPLNELFHKKYFINVSYSVAAERRLYRTYDPPDPPGYFEHVAWVEYKKHIKDLEGQTDIEYIDGSISLEELHSKLQKGIQEICTADKSNRLEES